MPTYVVEALDRALLEEMPWDGSMDVLDGNGRRDKLCTFLALLVLGRIRDQP